MGPLGHFLFTFPLVIGLALLLGMDITPPILALAVVGGLFPDFDHRRPNYVLAFLLTIGFWVFVTFPFFDSFLQGNVLLIYVIAAATGFFVIERVFEAAKKARSSPSSYRNQPKDWVPKDYAKVNDASTIAYTLAFALGVYLITNSAAYAFIGFVAYGSHRLLDYITYGTEFGKRYLGPIARAKWFP